MARISVHHSCCLEMRAFAIELFLHCLTHPALKIGFGQVNSMRLFINRSARMGTECIIYGSPLD